MINYLKKLYYKFKYRNYSASKEVYVVCRKINESADVIKVLSIHSSLKSAIKARTQQLANWGSAEDGAITVQRYGLWTN